MGRKLLTLPSVAATYTFLMNTWNTLPERYEQRVYKHTLPTVKLQIQPAENPTPAVVIPVETAHVDNAILLHYLTSEVVLEERDIGSSDPNIPIDNNCTDDKQHFGRPGGSEDFEVERDESDERNTIPTASWRRQVATELERFDLWTSDVEGYEGEDGDDANVDEEEAALQTDDESMQNVEDWGHIRFDLGTSNVDGYEGEDGEDVDEEEQALPALDGSTQNVEDWGHSTRECEDWTVYISLVKYDNAEANTMARGCIRSEERVLISDNISKRNTYGESTASDADQ